VHRYGAQALGALAMQIGQVASGLFDGGYEALPLGGFGLLVLKNGMEGGCVGMGGRSVISSWRPWKAKFGWANL